MPIKTANHFYDHLLVLRLFCTFIIFFYVRYVNSVKKCFSLLVIFMRFLSFIVHLSVFMNFYFIFYRDTCDFLLIYCTFLGMLSLYSQVIFIFRSFRRII